ncbi:MAG TPA: DNA polymerase I, partial [Burkholderiaceae bacterium]
APKGRKIVAADLSNIEGRMLAWLAGEEWKLQAFRDFDAGHGHDLYKLAYARSFRIDPAEVTSAQRQVGKVQELALGYGGGVGAFHAFAELYRLDLEGMADGALAAVPPLLLAQACEMLAKVKRSGKTMHGLSDNAWLACDCIKRAWREAHPMTVALWRGLEDAYRAATLNPGTTHQVRSMRVRRDGAWLRVRLPSGRFLSYAAPRVSEDGQLSYLGMNQYTRKWGRIATFGGKDAEQATQAASRDVLAANMPAIEADGMPIVLTVHDEILTEPEDAAAITAERLSNHMTTVPAWATGLPLAAKGFESKRYKKDD